MYETSPKDNSGEERHERLVTSVDYLKEKTLPCSKEMPRRDMYALEEKQHIHRIERCRSITRAVKTIIDNFRDHAADLVMLLCETCEITYMVEYDIPLGSYIKLMDRDGITIVLESIIGMILGSVEGELEIELPLDPDFSDNLFEKNLRQAKELRKKGQLEAKIVARYKNSEYTVDLKKEIEPQYS